MAVRDAIQIDYVIKRCGVDLKARGSGLLGLCPFHDEKTPSFQVKPAHGFYKCFGCGKGGDAFSFIMEYHKVGFVEAVKIIADLYNVRIETETITPEEEQAVNERTEMLRINRASAGKYQNCLLQLDYPEHHAGAVIAKSYLENERGMSQETMLKFYIGWAPDAWKFLTPMIIEKGLFDPASKLGLVATKNESNYDVFRNRIIFPIHDVSGNVVAFGGRTLLSKEECKSTGTAKYLNSHDSVVFNKSKVLYGLYQAQKAIRELKYAILVEGYTDVTSFHQYGAENTVATCGTALTTEHAKLLKRFTEHVVVCRDADDAGMKATMRDIDVLLQHGFKVDVLPLPLGEDPDTFARQFSHAQLEPAA